MLDCLILGDSLAVGVGQARPGCTVAARVGITSGAYIQTLLPNAPKTATHVVISLGVNDDPSTDTLANLRRLRQGIAAARVTWLLPGLKDGVRNAIRLVARDHGDALVDTAGQAGPDRLHPGADGYRRIAAWTDQAVGPPMQAQAQTQTQAPGSIFGAVTAGPFAAIPRRDFAFRMLPAAPR